MEGPDDPMRPVAEMTCHEDVVEAIRSRTLSGAEVSIAGAYACALAAHSILAEAAHDCYSRLLHAALSVARALPSDAALAGAVKRVLAAGDIADGPVNGREQVAEAIEAEAVRIHEDLRGL